MRVSEKIIAWFGWKKAVIATAFFAVCYFLINYSGIGVRGLLDITGGANILDFEFGYSAQKAYQMLGSLGEIGRAFYLSRILPLDFIFPISYAAFYTAWMAVLVRHIADGRGWTRAVLALPVLAMLFDWAENICVIRMLRQYPTVLQGVCGVSSAMTVLKFLFTVLSVVVLAMMFVLLLRSRRGTKGIGP